VPRRVRMPAADELFRTTAGNGTLVREGHDGRETREAREARGEEGTERPARERGHNPVAPPNAPEPAGAAGSQGPARTVPAPAASAEQAEAAAPVSAPPPEPAARPAPAAAPAPSRKVTAPRRPSGRERHDEKITVYVSPDELLGLEHARIMLRGEYGLAVDRGRIVREAVAALLADLDARGRDSILVKRLSAGGDR
jgi:hypothetical protein